MTRAPAQIPDATFWTRFESALGACAFAFTTIIVTLTLVIGGLGYIMDGARSSKYYVWGVLFLLGFVVEVIPLLRFSDALKARHQPLAPAVALMQPIWPLPLRPIVAVWWLAHMVLPVGAFVATTYSRIEGTDGLGYWVLYALSTIAGFALVYAANIYLVLAVSALLPKPDRVFAVWNRRWIADAAITALAYGLHASI